MDSIRLYRDEILVREITINNSGLNSFKRDYLGPSLPEFKSSTPDYNNYLIHELTDVQAEYIKRGGNLALSNRSEVDQTTVIETEGYTIVPFTVYEDMADMVEFDYKGELNQFDLKDYSPKSKKYLALIITSSNECRLMDLFHHLDTELREVKEAIENHPMTRASAMSANKWYDQLINKGGRFGKEIVAKEKSVPLINYMPILYNRFIL